MTADVVLSRLYDVTRTIPRGSDAQKSARCPAHDDTRASLSVRLDPGRVLVYCHAGCPTDAILASLGLGPADLFNDLPAPEQRPHNADAWTPCGHERAAEYPYRDEHGTVLYGVVRCVRKCFVQWRPDMTARFGRRWSLSGVRRVPYRLPEIVTAVADERVVWICEGEKDVSALVSRVGVEATCNSGGALKWTADHAVHLRDADVTVVADRDDAGRRHAIQVVSTLIPVARSIYVVQAAHGKDAHDHLVNGGTTGTFVQVWAPKPHPGDREAVQL